jgi:omega-6 fatty acid desaturase (delta-12 desaturase)
MTNFALSSPHLRQRSTLIGGGLFLLDALLYAVLISAVLLADSLIVCVIASVLLGCVIGNLLTLAHDALHDSLTNSRKLNRWIGTVCMLLAWHNQTLWRFDHNAEHHAFTNLKGHNSWSPASPDEFALWPWWRRWVYRVSRSGLGFASYYLIHGWLHKNTLPLGLSRRLANARTWRMGVVLIVFILGQLSALISIAGWKGLVLGAVVPHLVFCWFMGWAIWRQHTHPEIPWFETKTQWEAAGEPEEVSVRLDCSRVFHWASHWMMLHPAHHADSRIPCYRLGEAELILEQDSSLHILVADSGWRVFFKVLRTCQLYDFEHHAWVSFSGHRRHVIGRDSLPAKSRTSEKELEHAAA